MVDLVEAFIEFLTQLEIADKPYVSAEGSAITIDGWIPKDQLRQFLEGIQLDKRTE